MLMRFREMALIAATFAAFTVVPATATLTMNFNGTLVADGSGLDEDASPNNIAYTASLGTITLKARTGGSASPGSPGTLGFPTELDINWNATGPTSGFPVTVTVKISD